MFTKEAILVSGYDMNREGIVFSRMCMRRMEMIRRKFPKEKMRCTIFDVEKGTVTWYEPKEKTGKVEPSVASRTVIITNPDYNPVTDPRDSIESKVPFNFKPISVRNYIDQQGNVGYSFVADQDRIISITDVYTYIQDIGKGKDAGSLLELSFFAHGFEGGPVLVNSWDLGTFGEEARDPNDKDPRIKKDYRPPTMDVKLLGYFQKAFDKRGVCWSWGCSFPEGHNTFLATIFKTPKYKSKARLADNEKFDLHFALDKKRNNGAAIYDGIKKILQNYEKKKGGIFKEEKNVLEATLTMKDIKEISKSALDDSWGAVTAKATRVYAFAAFVGTYADPFDGVMGVMQLKDRSAWTKAESNMHERNPKHKIEPFHYFDSTIKFYATYLGRSQDPENRGYGLFAP